MARKATTITTPRPPATVVDMPASLCRKCRSPRRTPYNGTQIRQLDGITPDGRLYTRIIYRYTTCLNCGQRRVERTYE